MKKILVVLFALIISQPCVLATYEVNYNNAGSVINNYTTEFGYNAAFTPENTHRAGAINRQIKYENMYYENLWKPRTIIINNTTTTPDTIQQSSQQEDSASSSAQTNDTAGQDETPKTNLGTKTINGVTYYNVPVEE